MSIEKPSKNPLTLRPIENGFPFDFSHIRSNNKQNQITGLQKFWLLSSRKTKDLLLTINCYKSLSNSLKALTYLKTIFQEVFGNSYYTKVVKVGNEYYSFPYTHAWGSIQYKRDLRTHLNNAISHNLESARLLIVLLSITNKCPLQCEHCFEWDNLNKIDKLSITDIERSIQKIQDTGAISIHLSGGEPMLRMHEILPDIPRGSACGYSD